MAQALLKPAKWITYYKIFDFIFVMYATHITKSCVLQKEMQPAETTQHS